MIFPANSPVPQNSLMPPPADEQVSQAYRAAQVIAAGYTARAAMCAAPPQSFSTLGPGIVQEVALESQIAQQGLTSQSPALAQIINQQSGSGAIFTPEDISSAPQVVAASTTAPVPTYTQAQIAAAGPNPVDWTETMVYHPEGSRYPASMWRRARQLRRAGPVATGNVHFPGAAWSVPSAVRPGQCGNCGGGITSWGLLLLIVGGGIATYAALKR